ncbi:MAG: HAD hydrolase-like protein [Chloroflexi bacterium]|nr:HAD hydrolase-like protein [Chloroflexota bacterium]
MSKLVLLDIDGTLIASDGTGRAAMEAALIEIFGTAGDIATYRFGGRTDRDNVFTLLGAVGVPEEQIEAHFVRLGPLVAQGIERLVSSKQKIIRALPGALTLYDALHASSDTTIGVVTGNFRESAAAKMRAGGFDPVRVVAGAYGSESADRNQLPPLAVQRAFEATGLRFRGTDVVVIGDTVRDVRAGHAIGAKVITVLTGADDYDALCDAGADLILDDLSDNGQVLEAIFTD